MARKKKKKATKKKKKSTKKKKKSTKKRATKKKTTKKKRKATKKKTTKKSAAKKKPAKKTKSVKPAAAKPRSGIKVGDSVPNFELPATGDQKVRLNDLRGKKVVLYFYPKDSTPGCTVEGQDFTRLHGEFKMNNTEVFGVSRDSIRSHENFKLNENYSIDLISDENEEICSTFGVIEEKNMYGKMVRGIDRSTFVIDENGRLIKEWRQVKVPGHADEVLNYVKNL